MAAGPISAQRMAVVDFTPGVADSTAVQFMAERGWVVRAISEAAVATSARDRISLAPTSPVYIFRVQLRSGVFMVADPSPAESAPVEMPTSRHRALRQAVP
ncbi:hypothetical protein [Afipia sp. Root123D2]|uniref:hypothetical protein n=1 Tax=Afipia sp. Root123D2 TaxID=1736436 RepID=UPI0012E79FA6|nr:hypothetical protein [Afipia sp. Root123D2]